MKNHPSFCQKPCATPAANFAVFTCLGCAQSGYLGALVERREYFFEAFAIGLSQVDPTAPSWIRAGRVSVRRVFEWAPMLLAGLLGLLGFAGMHCGRGSRKESGLAVR